MGERIHYWQVDYGDGESHEVSVPHAWRQEVDVRFEGPVTYTAIVQVPREPSVLHFEGVSYEAVVSIDGEHTLTHRGIWDSFEVPLAKWAGRRVEVRVGVTKNGGDRFPVREVASGFLPYVYHTFGGIWGEVRISDCGLRTADQPTGKAASEIRNPKSEIPISRVFVDGPRLCFDGEPYYIRGLLHWGWYPEIGHHNAPEETIRREVREAKAMGFNLVKFCLWVPPHKYLEILEEEGMTAWLELPLWDPTSDPERLEEIGQEIERIVRQYRHHDNIIVWTAGCELSHATPPEYREFLVNLIQNLTGCPLVKDNSGGAEMYGGDLREFGTFFDYHPYCDTPFYPLVLDTLLPGPRAKDPILLGEFNDIDVHRDLCRIHESIPYWASSMPELNDKGVRWQYDLPNFLPDHPLATGDEFARHERLMESSRQKSLFIRKTVHEWVRARDPISGYVITGWRDTPISSAGFFDDWDRPRFAAQECLPWNGPEMLFLIPTRRPPWVDGGNRPGWLDPFNQFVGQVFFRVGFHGGDSEGGLVWRISSSNGSVVARGAEAGRSTMPYESTEVAQISWQCETPGQYRLEVEFAGAVNGWDFHVEPRDTYPDWRINDPRSLFGKADFGGGPNVILAGHADGLASLLDEGANVLVFLDAEGATAAPFWRESAYEFAKDAPFKEQWERLLAVSGDRVLDPVYIAQILPTELKAEILLNRVDVRTYQEAPVMVRVSGSKGKAIITTLRPYGGLGIQPSGLIRNAAGCALVREMMRLCC